MSFDHPLALLLLLLLVLVALLYWLRVRVPSRIVGTGLFWQRALAEEMVRRRWQRWRPKVSAAIQMLIVVLVALAAAGPEVPAAKRMVLILDNSATMRATDVQPTRLDEAKKVARRLIEGLRSCDEMAVVAVSAAPIEVQPLTSDKALLASAIDAVQATSDSAAIEWAAKLAREIPSPDKVPPRIVLITDACSREATKQAQQGGVEVLRVGTAAGNVAITRFTARRSKAEPAKCAVLVEVRNQGNQSAQGRVTIAPHPNPLPEGAGNQNLPSPSGRGAGGEGEPSTASAPFSISQDGRWQHVFSLDLATAARLTAKVEPGDVYPPDDTATLDVPAAPVPWKDEILYGHGEMGPIGLIGPLSRGPNEPVAADIRVPNDIGSEASALVIEKPSPPQWILPAVLAAGFLILEWCLYQRRWTS